MNRKYSLVFVLTLVFSASALTCVIISLMLHLYSGNTQYEKETSNDFIELLDIIDSRFIGSFDIEEIMEAAKRGAVDSLDDDWSYYMNPAEYTQFLASSNNRYSGIGVEVVVDEETGGIKVLGVYRDSGAHLAGIVIGDIIVAVDGESILGLTLSEIREMLRRPIDDTAVIKVLRADGEYYDLTVIYSIVFTDPVSYKMLNGNIGYLILKNFEEGAADRFIHAVNELIGQGAQAIIYDVRSNPGGRVGEVTRILDFLLPEGEIFIAVDRSGIENITTSDASFIDLPAVAIVNSFSYSGAEFFAAMLDEYDYAFTVGEQTTGKNRMQTTIPMTNGGAVHISTGHYLTKNRVSLYDIGGFTPQHLIDMTDEEQTLFFRGELEADEDPQILKALSLLSSVVN